MGQPFLPDGRGGSLPLDIAWLEYKHFSLRFTKRGSLAAMMPWPTGLTKIEAKDKEALRRRVRMFTEVEALAKRNNQTMREYIRTLMDTHKGKTVNQISTLIRRTTEAKEDVEDDGDAIMDS